MTDYVFDTKYEINGEIIEIVSFEDTIEDTIREINDVDGPGCIFISIVRRETE